MPSPEGSLINIKAQYLENLHLVLRKLPRNKTRLIYYHVTELDDWNSYAEQI
jgi:hypothetical protein